MYKRVKLSNDYEIQKDINDSIDEFKKSKIEISESK